jgi:hypothetical protein
MIGRKTGRRALDRLSPAPTSSGSGIEHSSCGWEALELQIDDQQEHRQNDTGYFADGSKPSKMVIAQHNLWLSLSMNEPKRRGNAQQEARHLVRVLLVEDFYGRIPIRMTLRPAEH